MAFKYRPGIAAARAALAPRRDGTVKPSITIYWGPSGTGKTRRAISENPGAYILTKPRDGKGVWWQGYSGQDTVIIDEFYGWIPYDFLLRILDWYHVEVEYKGGSVPLAATKFIFTSNKQWEEWYTKIDNVSALERRIREFGTIEKIEGGFEPGRVDE